jgi:gas vesicle protein
MTAFFLDVSQKMTIFARENHKLLYKNREMTMKSLGYIGAFLGGAIAGAAIGILVAPEKGQETRVKITDAVEDFLKKHNIKLSRKEVGDLVDDIQDVTDEE